MQVKSSNSEFHPLQFKDINEKALNHSIAKIRAQSKPPLIKNYLIHEEFENSSDDTVKKHINFVEERK